MLDWAKGRFKPDGKLYSHVSYSNEEEGVIAASAEEYIIFSSSALSLDRTRIYYQLLINTKDGKCDLMMTRIRYWYDEARDGGEKYSAEEWITDDMALNKKKTKLAPICGKFRRETIDLKDELFQSAASALGRKILRYYSRSSSTKCSDAEITACNKNKRICRTERGWTGTVTKQFKRNSSARTYHSDSFKW